MRLDRKRVLIALAGLAALCVMVAQSGGGNKATLAASEPKPAATAGPARAQAPGPFAQLQQRRPIGEPRGDMFAARSWAPPPPPPSAQPAPPPNPYRFAGTALHDGMLKFYVAEGDRVYEVRQGDELDKGFRVESVSREAIVLLYAPLGAQYSIEVSSTLTAHSEPSQRGAGVPDAAAGATTGVGW
jgi:hypothetical protein